VTYDIGIGFPVEPTEKDIKFGVVDGGKTKPKPGSDTDKTKPVDKKD